MACRDDILPACKVLRRQVWLKLLPDIHPFYAFLRDSHYQSKDEQQVLTDIRRCEHLNPAIFRDENVKSHLHLLILDFLAIAS